MRSDSDLEGKVSIVLWNLLLFVPITQKEPSILMAVKKHFIFRFGIRTLIHPKKRRLYELGIDFCLK